MNKKIVIPAVGAIIIILLICLIAFNKKDNTPNNPAQTPQAEQTNAGTDVNNLEEMNKLKQQQQEELQKQDELMEAHDEATVEVTEITEDGEATLHIVNEDAGIDETMVIRKQMVQRTRRQSPHYKVVIFLCLLKGLA